MTDNNKKTHLVITGRGGGGSGEQVQADWNQSDNTQPDYIKNKPELATVATTGDYDDLQNKPTIPEAQVQADWQQNDSSAVDYIKNKPSLPSAQIQSDWNQTNTSEVDYIKNKPTIPAAQVNSDWNSTSGVSEILNKPSLATVATSGNYSDLNGTPSLATVATSGDYDDLQNKPTIPVVPTNVSAFTNDAGYTTFDGDYNSLTNKPTIPAAQVNSDWNSNSGVSQILNKPSLATVATSGNYSDLNGTPTLATVATSGDYDDLQNKPTIPVVPTNVSAFTNDAGYTTFDGDYNSLTNKPTIPAAQVNSDWNSNSGVSQILNKPSLATVATSGNYSDLNGTPSLATVATSGDYDDLQNKPTIPAAPVQSDWNEADSSSLAYIANKPTIPAAQVNSDWNANSGVAQILNKPTIPVVPAMTTETLTFTLQGGTVVTLNVYVEPSTPTQAPYFYIEDLSGSDSTLRVTNNEEHTGLDFEVFYSTDQQNWSSMGEIQPYGSVTATVPANGKVYLKANTDGWSYDEETWYNSISVDRDYAVGGNIMSLLYGDNYVNQTTFPTGSAYNFHCLFADMNDTGHLISAQDLILPATTLTDYCYHSMFQFCTGLTTAPALPATTLANNCYQWMFQGCTSLNKVTTYAQDISATDCLDCWLETASATGDFYNLGGATYTSGASGIPSGWTEHTSL